MEKTLMRPQINAFHRQIKNFLHKKNSHLLSHHCVKNSFIEMSNDNGNFIVIIKNKLFDGILSIYFMIFDNKIKINLWASDE